MTDPASPKTSTRAPSGASPTQAALARKLDERTALIGIVGLGYVGLPLAVEFASRGFRTIGIDLNRERVLRLNAGQNVLQDINDEDLRRVVDAGTFSAEDDFASAAALDVVFICVPTPVTPHKDPDTSYIRAATEALAPSLRAGQLIVLKSTTYPNTTEGVLLPVLEQQAGRRDMQVGRDYFVAFSPERIDPGNRQFTTANTPVVVGGVTAACTDLAARAMQQVVEHVHRVSSPKVAEMEKLLENIFRSVNIALVNELAQLCDRMGGISIWEVVEAAATKPFGFMPFYPGPGLGGHCIPIDPYYLSWAAREYDFETGFITLSARVNEQMPFYVRDAILTAIAAQPVRLEDAKVLVLGVAFKRNVDDTRHSPAIKLIELLHERGIRHVAYSDPHVETLEVPTHHGTLSLHSTPLDEAQLRAQDVVAVVTDHSAFPYAMIAEEARLIVDTRNALRDIPHNRDRVLLLGGGSF